MKITTLEPSSELNSVIDKYWHCIAKELNSEGILIPMMNHKIVIDFSDQVIFRWETYGKRFNGGKNLIFGLHTKPLKTIAEGRYESIGILLKPNGLYELFGLNANICLNKVIDLNQLFGEEFEELTLHIKNESEPVNKLHMLDSFIYRTARYYKIDRDITSFYEEFKYDATHTGKIGEYIGKTNKPHSLFIQSFKKVYGTTPKQFLLLQQINRSLKGIVESPEQPLVEIAMDSGFYDQAHFIKTFKKYTGILPNHYRKKVKAGNVAQESPNFILMN